MKRAGKELAIFPAERVAIGRLNYSRFAALRLRGLHVTIAPLVQRIMSVPIKSKCETKATIYRTFLP